MFAEEGNGLVKIEIGERRLSLNMDSDMVYYSLSDRTYRRTRMNDIIELRYIGGRRSARLLEEEEKAGIASAFYRDVEATSMQYPSLKRYVKDYSFLETRGKMLREIYGGKIPIVPPDRYFSLYIKISEGCPWNKCSFCNLYKDRKYMPLKIEKIKEEVDALKSFFRNSMPAMNGIFLGDANAVSMNFSELDEVLLYLGKEFRMPFYAFSDAFTTPLKNTDFERLHKLGMKRIYIGIESGNPDILRMLNKKMELDIAREFIEKIKEAGINVGLIVMSGFGEEHVESTVDFLGSMEYSKGDMVYISPVKEYGNFHEVLLANGIKDNREIAVKEYENIRNSLRSRLKIPVVVYSLDEAMY
ncbi:MAG: radical SAM protein [Ferroplasma sp.]|uniref:radical SAM protein n=1 Tax=Ferroplasma sp. TaxID=2591003 RepID=UPI002814A359|nr:radical SAM protein [Ferroplasma sp.]WMT50822.1 MAG: radical SAM protein [Ferroplasma sp.]